MGPKLLTSAQATIHQIAAAANSSAETHSAREAVPAISDEQIALSAGNSTRSGCAGGSFSHWSVVSRPLSVVIRCAAENGAQPADQRIGPLSVVRCKWSSIRWAAENRTQSADQRVVLKLLP